MDKQNLYYLDFGDEDYEGCKNRESSFIDSLGVSRAFVISL